MNHDRKNRTLEEIKYDEESLMRVIEELNKDMHDKHIGK